jgi:hypothetical protein
MRKVKHTDKGPVLFIPITVAPLANKRTDAHLAAFHESVVSFVIRRMHIFSPGHLPCTTREARDRLANTVPPTQNPWAPQIIFLLQPCALHPETPQGILYGLAPALLREPRTDNSIATYSRVYLDLSRHIHNQLSPYFAQREKWQQFTDFYAFHAVCGFRPSTYTPPNDRTLELPAIYICSSSSAFVSQLVHLITINQIKLSAYGRTVSLTTFPPPTNLRWIRQAVSALQSTHNTFLSLMRVDRNPNAIHYEHLSVVLPTSFSTDDYPIVCSYHPDTVALIPIFSLETQVPTHHLLYVQINDDSFQQINDIAHFLPPNYLLSPDSMPTAVSDAISPFQLPASSFDYAFSQLTSTVTPVSPERTAHQAPSSPAPANKAAPKRSRPATPSEPLSIWDIDTSSTSLSRAAAAAPPVPMDTTAATHTNESEEDTPYASQPLYSASQDSHTTLGTNADCSTLRDEDDDEDAFMLDLEPSQPVPRSPARQLPDELIHIAGDRSTAAEYETLLQQVPPHAIDAFYGLIRTHFPPATIRDHVLPQWSSPPDSQEQE